MQVTLSASADRVPQLNIKPGCEAAATTGVTASRNTDACLHDEQDAHDKLKKEWGQFTRTQRQRCTSLTRLGGPPSYVELLTCLELAKQAENLPDKKGLMAPIR
jgi:hypothetical protein